MKVNVNVVLFSLILKNLVAICQLQDNKLSILTVVSTEFGAENYTWFFLAIFELDMGFLIQCALVRSKPRCSRSIAALLNKGSFLPSSQYYAKLAWIRGRVLVPIGPHTSHVTLHPAFPLAAVFNLPTLSARLYPAASTGYTEAYSLSSFSTLYRRSIRSKP